MTVRQAERDVRQAAGGVYTEFHAQTADQTEHLLTGRAHGTDWHDQRVNHDVVRRNTVVGGASDNFPGDLETHIGIFRDAGFVI